MQATAVALRCLEGVQTASLGDSDASVGSSVESWPSCSSLASAPVEAAQHGFEFTLDVAGNSPAHVFLDGLGGADFELIDALGAALEVSIAEDVAQRDECITATGVDTSPVTGRLTPFHGLRPPPISVTAYLRRILQYSKCSPVCFVMALTYLERLAKEDSVLAVSALNVHRLLITGVLLAAKLMDDNYFNNSYYAKIGGIGVAELNRLELEMMQLLGYRLRVAPPVLEATIQRLLFGSASCSTASSETSAADSMEAATAPETRPSVGAVSATSRDSTASGAAADNGSAATVAQLLNQISALAAEPAAVPRQQQPAVQQQEVHNSAATVGASVRAAVGGVRPSAGQTAARSASQPPLSFAAVARAAASARPPRPAAAQKPAVSVAKASTPPSPQPQPQPQEPAPVVSPAPVMRAQSWPAVSKAGYNGGSTPASFAGPRQSPAPSFAAVVAAPTKRPVHAPVRGAGPPAGQLRTGSHDRPVRMHGMGVYGAAGRQLAMAPSRLPDAIKAC